MGLWFTSLAMGNLLASRLAGSLDGADAGGMAGYFSCMFWFGIAAARRAAADASRCSGAGPTRSQSHVRAMTDPRQRRMLVLCLATVYLVWGTSYMATRVGVLQPATAAVRRRALLHQRRAAHGRGLLARLSLTQLDGQWGHLLVMSLLGISVCNGLQVWAMQWVPSHTGALLNASSALWIVIFGLFGARVAPARNPAPLPGLVIGFIGTVLLVWPAHKLTGVNVAETVTPLVPQLVILLACIVWSLGTIYMRNHSRQDGPVRHAGNADAAGWSDAVSGGPAARRIGRVDLVATRACIRWPTW